MYTQMKKNKTGGVICVIQGVIQLMDGAHELLTVVRDLYQTHTNGKQTELGE